MTGNTETEVVCLDASTLEVRHCDDGRGGKCRCWTLPAHEAHDIARWWSQYGPQLELGATVAEVRFGSVPIGLMRATQIYARGCDQLGPPKMAGYQLPRDAVALLHDWLAERDPATVVISDVAGA
jgi:hypothetical protein